MMHCDDNQEEIYRHEAAICAGERIFYC
jgi:hypothetical protein